MTAVSKVPDMPPEEVEALLPWHAAGTLSTRDARRVDEALARDVRLARQYAVIQEEFAETIHLNESLGAPSSRAMQRLFAGIDAEPARAPSVTSTLSARIAGFFASLSPRTLSYAAGAAALALLLQAGVIGALIKGPSSYQTASLSMNEPASLTRDLGGAGTPPRALVRFSADARMSDISTLLDTYQATIVGGANGLFRLQFGSKAMGKDEVAGLMNKLRGEKIVSLAEAAP